MKAIWRFLSGRRSPPGRGIDNRHSSARASQGRHYETKTAFEARVGRPDALPRSSDSSFHFSTGRLALFGLAIVGIVWFGWRIVADTAAYNLAAVDPEAAVAWMPGETIALTELAFREFKKSDGDLDVAHGLAERALRSDPLDARALAALGLIAERQGNQARADILMGLSAARTWRDVTTQAWLASRDIQRGEFEQALSHIDALMRVNPMILGQVFPVLSAFTLDNRTFDVLASFLATAPAWRAGALHQLSSQLPDAARLVQLYAALKKSDHPPDTRELSPYLGRLIREGQFAEAYQTWRETLPPHRTREANLYNGDFAAPIDGLPFNWLLQPAPGMDIQIVASPGKAESRVLQLQFSGARVAAFTVGQLLLLPPGAYRLTGNVKAEELHTQRGLRWQVSCTESSASNALATTNLVANAMPWTRFSVDFTVPTGNCRGQWLNLEIPSRTASERQIDGQIWYENMQIARIGQGQLPSGQ